jgi:signal transduction histidine kinase
MLPALHPLVSRFGHSLRVRVALGVALPLMLALSALSLVHNWRERRLMEEQVQVSAVQVGQVITGSLQHAMEVEDRDMLANVLKDVGTMEGIERVQIVDLDGVVKADSATGEVGRVQGLNESGCAECHRFPPETRPRTVFLANTDQVLRIAAPIANGPTCVACHSVQNKHLGMLLTDVPMLTIEQHLAQDLRITLLISGIATLLMTIGVYLLVQWLVVRRVEVFHQPLARYATGDFTSRVPVRSGAADEVDELASTFNQMADELERHSREERERSQWQQRVVAEERDRIARELHDGLAQLLGYVNTKAMAVRLLLKNRQIKTAETQLLQIEEAAREMFVEVREAIIGLKVTGKTDVTLAAMLKEYAAQFSRLSDLPVDVLIAPGAESLPLRAETELQMLRIAQEALANVRKHAAANSAWIDLKNDGGVFELSIGDDGQGFDPDRIHTNHQPHFGLATMRERAEAIGAKFSLNSRPGGGTRVAVRLTIKEN